MAVVKSIQLRQKDSEGRILVFDLEVIEDSDCSQSKQKNDNRFLVNFRYGELDSVLQDGARTLLPVNLDKADELFSELVAAKKEKGYIERGDFEFQQEQEKRQLEKKEKLNKECSDTEEVVSPTAELISPLDESLEINDETLQIQSDLGPEDPLHSNLQENRILDYLSSEEIRKEWSWPLSRVIWRAGELCLASAADLIAQEVERHGHIVDYSIAWSLGRCGNKSHLPVLTLLKNSQSRMVRDMANESFVYLAPMAIGDQYLDELKRSLPFPLQDAIKLHDTDSIASISLSILSQKHYQQSLAGCKSPSTELLMKIYTLAITHSACHQAIVKILEQLSLREKGFFKAFRRLLKLSEFRLDGIVYGLISQRIDASPASWRQPYFKEKTKKYLQKRILRTIKQLGQDRHEQYVPMAMGILFAIKDEHADTEKRFEYAYKKWNIPKDIDTRFNGYSRFIAFNYILFGNSDRYEISKNGLSWRCLSSKEPSEVVVREDAFPGLWDQAPDKLLCLLLNSQCRLVHEFAVKALNDNKKYCSSISVEEIVKLLKVPYECTNEFALSLAKSIYLPEYPRIDLIKACASSKFQSVRDTACQWLEANPAILINQPSFLTSLMLVPHVDIQEWLDFYFKDLHLSNTEKLSFLYECLEDLRLVEEHLLRDRQEFIVNFIERYFRPNVKLDLKKIESLWLSNDYGQPSVDSYTHLIGKLLIAFPIGVAELSEALIRCFVQSPSAECRAIGLKLLENMDDKSLLARCAIIIDYCLNPPKGSEDVAYFLLAKIVGGNETQAHELVSCCVDRILLADIEMKPQILLLVRYLERHFKDDLHHIEAATRFSLLFHPITEVQNLGLLSLTQSAASSHSVYQWSKLSHHNAIAVRQWAWSAFLSDDRRVNSALDDALAMLESPWPDTLEFAVSYLDQYIAPDKWTAERLMFLIDHPHSQVRKVGQLLIQKTFNPQDGLNFALKLVQHPREDIQYFATHFLFLYAKQNVEVLNKMEGVLLTIFLSVRSKRSLKNRMMKFLTLQAEESVACAEFLIHLIRQVLDSHCQKDQSLYLQTLVKVQRYHPELEFPIKTKLLSVKTKKNRHKEVSHVM